MLECLSVSNRKGVRMFKRFAQWSSYPVSELTPWLCSTLRVPNSGDCQTAVTEPTSHKPILHKGHFARDTKIMNKNPQYFGTVYGCIKSEATRCWENPKPRWHMLPTNSRTQSSMKHLSKSKAGTSSKHSDGFHMEINVATEKFGLCCQSMKTVFCGVFLFALILCLWLVFLFWTSFSGHLYLNTKIFCKQNI